MNPVFPALLLLVMPRHLRVLTGVPLDSQLPCETKHIFTTRYRIRVLMVASRVVLICSLNTVSSQSP